MKNIVTTSAITTFDLTTTEEAIELVKTTFIKALAYELDLQKVSAPVVVLKGTGINDDLSGLERPVGFPLKDLDERQAEVVHSLAKWKRLRLYEYSIPQGKGIVTDMRALRPDEELSPLHSIYVDQFDWEKHIGAEERTLTVLKATVQKIYQALRTTEHLIYRTYPILTPFLPESITFIHTEDLLVAYPDLSPKEREDAIVQKHGAVFLIGIGGKLAHGEKHDGRAPDYDDWSTPTTAGHAGLNGDLLLWHPILERAFELSSMGIRVDAKALLHQLQLEGAQDRQALYFHQLLLQGLLPQSIGGGIGQSRLAMLLLQKRHIGEVQVSIWSDEIRAQAASEGLQLM